MQHSSKSLRSILSFACVLLSACGPNTFTARGVVLNPLYDRAKAGPETANPPQILVIQRKETRSQQVAHTIVGPHKRPLALKLLGEFCEIMPDLARPGRLVFQCLLFSNYRDELEKMEFGFTLALSDGRKVEGVLHMKHALQDHTVSVTGAHKEPYLTVRDRRKGTVTQYTYIQEVENEFPLFSRQFKIIFEDRDLIRLDTPYVILVIDGYQRRWKYRYDFTNDPDQAMQSLIDRL